MDRLDAILAGMALTARAPDTQRAQTRYRMGLVDTWAIPEGASVLEIGCGQGDMTAVLAEAVGPTGRVVALDNADPSYGSPVSIGESMDHLKASPLGDRVDARFLADVLDESLDFPADSFDFVVMSHCSWYFESVEGFEAVLRRIRPWALRLCFAEWDLRPRSLDQMPHLLAVLVQGQVEATSERGDGNVRTPSSHEGLLRSLARSGWGPSAESSVDTSDMQDADWEIDACFRIVEERGEGLPGLVRDFVYSQVDVLRGLARERGNTPLPSYVLVAERV
ncbi:class I SAM-dependent methyltransferase [Umezawaea tangerina]|uniref:Methyltransferase family protein n=1 Tax=Umezawaea tangerina TaxID=84725 RepID=A0A2T0SP24_9PSEU|nr:methyltransferase domain-containing protein [Umezawaea tangerina]PRY35157.1 methyltransferase family protein [Umezawaea tangerina]